MNFSNKNILSTFGSGDSQNAWANIESIGWRKISSGSADGVTNMFLMLNAAVSNNRKVSGNIDGSDQITVLYLH